MTSQQKQDIYKLCALSSAWILGCADSSYTNDVEFTDDPIVQIENSDKNSTENAQTRLEAINKKIALCTNCPLSKTRTNVVPGEGAIFSPVLVIGEAPGEDEDKTGRPFVGKAGQLLDKMLYAINLDRNCNCFIANVVKCRPPKNRTPFSEEAESCASFLQAQIHILKPKMILALGRCSAQNLFKTEQGITALRGKFFDVSGIPTLATYHPSALLRDESLKRFAWADLKLFRSRLQELCPDYAESFLKLHGSV